MTARRKIASVALAGILGLVVALVAPAFACAPLTIIQLSPSSVEAGRPVFVRGSGFLVGSDVGPVEVQLSHMDGGNAVPLGTMPGPSFQLTFVSPDTRGSYLVRGIQRRSSGEMIAAGAAVLEVEAPPVPRTGYRLVASDGGLFAFGDAGFFGSMGGKPLNRPVVGTASTPSGQGYWEVASDGGIFAFGDAGFFGSMGGRPLAKPIVGMASTPSGQGYWLVASDGGIFAFGDAPFLGSTGGLPLVRPVVGMARMPSGLGYWLAGADGGVFAFGDAPFLGSFAGVPTATPIVGIAAPGPRYWLADSLRGVHPFGSTWGPLEPPPVVTFDPQPLPRPIVGIAAISGSAGHWIVSDDGQVYARQDAPFLGSLQGVALARPIVGLAASRG